VRAHKRIVTVVVQMAAAALALRLVALLTLIALARAAASNASLTWVAGREAAGAAALLWAAALQDSACTDMPDVPKDVCLGKAGGKCMWLQLDSKNLCLPCSWDGHDIPCAPPDATYPDGRVQRCEMACRHGKVLTSLSSCTDVSGLITQSDCEAKGTSVSTKCMWTAYKTKDGEAKSMCGPCFVHGIGQIPAYVPGGTGPEPWSKVDASSSQCEEVHDKWGLPCDPVKGIPAVTPCRPTPPPMLPGGLPPPVALETLGLKAMPGAPDYVAVPVAAPYDRAAFTRAATAAARVAGWPAGAILPPHAAVGIPVLPPPEGPMLPPDMPTVSLEPPPGLLGLPTVPPGSMPMPMPMVAFAQLNSEPAPSAPHLRAGRRDRAWKR